MKRIKLMQITHDLAIGGLQQVVVNICSTIDRDRFDVSVLCLREAGAFVPEIEKLGIPVFTLPRENGKTDYLSFLKVARILKREQIDVVHTHNTHPFIDGTIAALISGVKTIVHTDHARDFPDKKRYMLAEWCMSHFAYKVVGVSDHTSENLIKYEKISPHKIVTIMNGIYEGQYAISIDKEKKKRELGIDGHNPVIGLGVRLTEQKGITYLLKAMPNIMKVYPDIALVIAGDGPLKNSLQEETTELGIDKNVFFVGPRLDMPELLKMFDLYVLPSLWEGLPMVLLEAMAAGCPIVCTDVGGVSSAIIHGFTGSLVSSMRPDRLSDEINSVLSDSSLRRNYTINALNLFRDKFSATIMTRRYEQLYKRIA